MSLYDRTYGIEIEAIAPRGMSSHVLALNLQQVAIPVIAAGYSHARTREWKIVSDASLRADNGGQGMEIVSPPLSGEDGMTQTLKVCEVLKMLGFTVNRTCGLHVHVDARRLSIDVQRRLALTYRDAESVIDSLMPASRRGSTNVYASSLRNASVDAIAAARDSLALALALRRDSRGSRDPSRYVKVNYCAADPHRRVHGRAHGTVEFRQHAGTIEYQKVRNWTLFCLRLVDKCANDVGTAAPVATAPRALRIRPRTKLAVLAEMVMRQGGATRQEITQTIAWPSCNIERHCTSMGIALTRTREGRTVRYEALRGTTMESLNAPSPVPQDLDGLAAYLAMPEEELSYWAERRLHLAGLGVNTTE